MSMNNLSVDGEFRYIVQWFKEWSELQRDDFVPIVVDYLLRDSPAPGVYMNGVVHSMSSANISNKPMSLFQCRIKLFRQWNPKWPQEFKNALKEKICEIDSRIGEKIAKSLIKQQNGDVSNDIDTKEEEFSNATEIVTETETTNAAQSPSPSTATAASVSVSASSSVNIIPPIRSYVRPNLNNGEEVNGVKEAEAEEEEEATSENLYDNSGPNNAAALIATTATELTPTTTINLSSTLAAIDADHHIAEVLRKETPVDDDDDDEGENGKASNNEVNNEPNNQVLAVSNVVQDNITRVTVNATDIINDVTFGNGYAVEPVEQDQVEHDHVVANSSPVTVNVSVSQTAAEVPLVA